MKNKKPSKKDAPKLSPTEAEMMDFCRILAMVGLLGMSLCAAGCFTDLTIAMNRGSAHPPPPPPPPPLPPPKGEHQ